MGLMNLAREARIGHHGSLNGTAPVAVDNDVLQAFIKAAVKEGIREALLNIPGVRAVRWIIQKLKLTR